MVLVMESDGSLTPSRSQDSFARNYNDGIGQGSAANELAILGEAEPAIEPDALRFAALSPPAAHSGASDRSFRRHPAT